MGLNWQLQRCRFFGVKTCDYPMKFELAGAVFDFSGA
jgi:hypothetical protein